MLHVVQSTLNVVDEHWSMQIHTACVCPAQHVKCLMQQATVVVVLGHKRARTLLLQLWSYLFLLPPAVR